MATGNPPHSEKSGMMVMFKIKEWDSPSLPADDNRWSDEFRDFIRSCLIKNPKERPSAEELIQKPWIRNADDIGVLSKWIRTKLKHHHRNNVEHELHNLIDGYVTDVIEY